MSDYIDLALALRYASYDEALAALKAETDRLETARKTEWNDYLKSIPAQLGLSTADELILMLSPIASPDMQQRLTPAAPMRALAEQPKPAPAKAARAKKKYFPMSDEQKTQAQNLIQAGHDVAVIADSLGINQDTLRKFKNRFLEAVGAPQAAS